MLFSLFIHITMTIVEIIGFCSLYRFFTYTIDKKDSYKVTKPILETDKWYSLEQYL